MRRAPTVADFEANMPLCWFFELTPLERQILCNVANVPGYARTTWAAMSPAVRLALTQAALMTCELAAKLAPELER